MRTCSGIRTDGGRCQAQPMRNSEYCLNHDPSRAEENRRRSSKGGKRGGRGRPRVEVTNVKTQLQVALHFFDQVVRQADARVPVTNVKTQLQELADAVRENEINRADAAVVSQILNVLLRAITIEAQLREREEFAQRLEALEAALAHRKGRPPYGA